MYLLRAIQYGTWFSMPQPTSSMEWSSVFFPVVSLNTPPVYASNAGVTAMVAAMGPRAYLYGSLHVSEWEGEGASVSGDACASEQ